MSAPRTEQVVDAWALSEPERIALAYFNGHRQDGWAALVAAVTDALADLGEAERQSLRQERSISRGYVRGRIASGS